MAWSAPKTVYNATSQISCETAISAQKYARKFKTHERSFHNSEPVVIEVRDRPKGQPMEQVLHSSKESLFQELDRYGRHRDRKVKGEGRWLWSEKQEAISQRYQRIRSIASARSDDDPMTEDSQDFS